MKLQVEPFDQRRLQHRLKLRLRGLRRIFRFGLKIETVKSARHPVRTARHQAVHQPVGDVDQMSQPCRRHHASPERRSAGRLHRSVNGIDAVAPSAETLAALVHLDRRDFELRSSLRAGYPSTNQKDNTPFHAASLLSPAFVAHALLRAASALLPTPGRAQTRCRDESRHGTHECVRHKSCASRSLK